MASHDLPTPPSLPLANDPVTWTTRRGMATWSFAIGMWSMLVFWWYPYSLFVSGVGLILGVLSLIMGWKGGKDGENLALGGVALCSLTLVSALTLYRGMQLFFGDLSTPIAP